MAGRKVRIVKKVLLVLVAIVGVFAVVVATRPSAFRVERSATIAAPPAKVFAQVNDFHAWDAWSPWAKLDPASKVAFEGPAVGVGAIFKWAGNDQVGEGMMTVTESRPNDLIRIKLDFIKPFAATNTAEFTFKPQGDGTAVTWSMFGHNNFMGRAMCMVMNMDKMVGGDFEKGLAQMKVAAEAGQGK